MRHSSKEYQQQWLKDPENRRKQYEHVKKWKEKHKEEVRLHRATRRARLKNAKTERIYKKKIKNWESRICGICEALIEGDYHIDHIVPLSRGGKHATSNLQLAHPFCNRSKFTKLTEELLLVS